jgi:hypothetical protein
LLSARRAFRGLSRIRLQHVDADRAARQVITRSSPFQSEILAVFGVDASNRRSQLA